MSTIILVAAGTIIGITLIAAAYVGIFFFLVWLDMLVRK